VLIPRELREFASLTRDAILFGQGNKFELWDEKRWNERRDQWLAEQGQGWGDLPAELESLSL
jgi:MraZ protein